MSLRPQHGVALAALLASTLVLAAPAVAHAAPAPDASAPSAGPRVPGDAPAQLTTGMMPPDSPDAVPHPAAPGSRSAHAAAGVLDGLDVASYQHPDGAPITWSQVGASGQSFVVIKATESTTYTNPYEAGDVAGARQAGLRVGLYHFARPSLQSGNPAPDATAEADYFSQQVNAVTGAQLPPTLDLEQNGGLSVSQLVTWTAAFLTRVQADTGRRPMIYTGPSFWNTSMGGSTAFTIYPLWEAHYTAASSPQAFGGWPTWTFWQWSNGTFGSPPAVPGMPAGAVDRDRFAGTMSGLFGVESASDGVTAPFTGTASPWSIPDGSLVQLAGTGEVYVVAGTAPVYLDSWTGYPGPHTVRVLSAAQFYSLRSSPRDGTFLNSVRTGQVYRVVGQAPVYVTSWQPWGQGQPYVNVGQGTVDSAGQPGVWSHLAAVPQDGTFVTGLENGTCYRMVGGAPVYVSSWSYFGGVQPLVGVNETSIDDAVPGPAAAAGVFQHLYQRPADGAFVSDPTAGTYYTTRGGALTPVDDSGQAFTAIGDSAVVNAGQPGVWSHLAAPTG